ncbi:WEB family protein At3g51220 [Rhododendron vialii]|uniref:WEB family protein At3g51220 n=1 Tax=Rhododendron vialii TaxID=182163 RepID=UPI00265E2435|nr:WEB family protein At3g51220 [Rhododendron vialii]
MEEEPQTPPLLPPPPATFLSSTIDTSRPFSSVKEAVAVFGQKHLAQEIFHSSSPNNYHKSPMWKFSPKINPTKKNEPNDGNDQNTLACTVKKLEAELEATKTELKLLKEREEDTEVAVASLNAELHKNMSKIAKAEAAAAAKAAMVARTESIRERERRMEEEYLPTMAQILGGGEEGKGLFGETEKERGGEKVVNKKQQPIVPLVWKLFSRTKGSSTPSPDSSPFSSTHGFFN